VVLQKALTGPEEAMRTARGGVSSQATMTAFKSMAGGGSKNCEHKSEHALEGHSLHSSHSTILQRRFMAKS